MLARRLNGKYLTPDAQHLLEKVRSIEAGEIEAAMQEMMNKSDEEIREAYNTRDIEK